MKKISALLITGLSSISLQASDFEAEPRTPRCNSTPLHTAARLSKPLESIQALLATQADPNNQDSSGNTPLHFAAYNCTIAGSSVVAQNLIAAGAQKEARNKKNEAPQDILKRVVHFLDAF